MPRHVITGDAAGGDLGGTYPNPTASGGSGSPGGSDTQIQFNDATAFGGDAALTFDKTSGHVAIGPGSATDSDIAGVPTPSSNTVTVSETFTDFTVDAAVVGLGSSVNANPSADADTAFALGLAFSATTDAASTTNLGNMAGVYGQAIHKGSGVVDKIYGAFGLAGSEGGTLNQSFGGYFKSQSGTISVGSYSQAVGTTGGTAYGAYIADTIGGDTNYQLYSNGTAPSVLNGSLGIGAVPTSPLQAVGLPVYPDNASAIAGGLTEGAFYRTGADPDPVCVVH